MAQKPIVEGRAMLFFRHAMRSSRRAGASGLSKSLSHACEKLDAFTAITLLQLREKCIERGIELVREFPVKKMAAF